MAPRRSETPSGNRRSDILDAAQRLVTTKGYEQMTIEDILTELHISKGAFYHYFDSKADLLQALVTRMRDETCNLLAPVLEDPNLTALQKLQRWFDTAAQWKAARKDYLLMLLRVWYHDDNAVVRQKLRADMLAWMGPMLTPVIRQGIDEGVFATPFPDHIGQVVFSLLYELGDGLAAHILSGDSGEAAVARARRATAAFTDAIERALGTPTGSLSLIDPHQLQEWYLAPAAAAP
ncbi:MAG TPA: TetR/AcrR family transcriptional regulator [Anaerolineales bacterium]|nr:TetR/AcrR family transcriptional regulator [Anaerolineales bacterium]